MSTISGTEASQSQRVTADDTVVSSQESAASGLAQRALGPRKESLPQFPASWYRFGDSKKITDKPVAREMLGRRLAAYRDSAGRAFVIDGRCPHMGADLSRGRVVGDTLQCPFHGWRFNTNGTCVAAPGCGGAVPSASVRTYQTAERMGSLYFFWGQGAPAPMPFFDDENPNDFCAARIIVIDYPAPWYQVIGNAFDVQHFLVVHDRKLTGASTIDTPSPYSRRWRYSVEITGQSLVDRFLSYTFGNVVDVTQHVWFGNVLLTKAVFARAENRVLFVLEPTSENNSRMEIQVLARKSKIPLAGPIVDRLSLMGRRFLTHEFLKHEVTRLGSLRYYSGGLVEADRPFIDFLEWLISQPQTRQNQNPGA